MMDRKYAYNMVKENLNNENLLSHSLAVEAVMEELAERLGQDREAWGLAGLLHDIDYSICADAPERHGLHALSMLEGSDIEAGILHAISAHNPATGVELLTLLDRALFAADPITGFITACVLVRPDKKIAGLEVSSLKKKFKDKAFARGADRGQIDTCQSLGLERTEFLQIALDAMKRIADEIGL